MGCLTSLCSKKDEVKDQYKSLVIDKPAPVELNVIHVESSDSSDSVLFPDIQDSSSDDPVVLPDPEMKTQDGSGIITPEDIS